MKLYHISSTFAKENCIPAVFLAESLRETPKAVFLFGHGTLESQQIGTCSICGRELTHPVSVQLGIGPECGSHFHNWDLIGGYSVENIERLKKEMTIQLENQLVNQWIPRSVIKQTKEQVGSIPIPANHPMNPLIPEKSAHNAPVAELIENQRIRIRFEFDRLLIDRVKTLPDRRYNPDGKYWTLPLIPSVLEFLKKEKFMFSAELEEMIQPAPKPAEIDSRLNPMLFPYQQEGIRFIESHQGRCLIGDEMGLGKTAQALSWLALHPEKTPVIIVTPASLKLNWEKEAQIWMKNPAVQILSGTKPKTPTGKYLIINYDILPQWLPVLKEIKAKVLVTDECHYFKNRTAKRTKAVKELGKFIPHVICLSGTPILNRPVEIFNALNLIAPNQFPNFMKFAFRYCGARHTQFGWDFSGATNTKELHEMLTSTLMIRRRKDDVLKELPEKLYSFVPLELGNKRVYEAAEADFLSFVRETQGMVAAAKASNAAALTQIEGLKQLAVQGKLEQAVSWIRDHLEINGKLVVFATHKMTIDRLMEEFREVAVKIDGSTPVGSRQEVVDQFQNNEHIRLFVGNIKAAGVGITLTAARDVAFLELPWTPGELSQATDRCHRIGQRNNVTAYYLLAVGTIEEKIAKLLDKKQQVLNTVLDGSATITQDSMLMEIIGEYHNN